MYKSLHLVLVFLLLAIYVDTSAKNVYVDAVAGNDSNPGDKARPWKSIAKVNATTFAPGDSIFFKKGGTWTGQLELRGAGTQAKPIVVTSYDVGAKPVIRNPGVQYGASIMIFGDWYIVDGFLVRDAQEAGVNIRKGADHNVVRNIEATATGAGISVAGRQNLVTNTYSHDLVMAVNTVGGDDDYGAVGIWLYGSGNEISYNKMVNCVAPSYDYGFDGGMVEFFGNVDSSYVHHNWGENCNGAFEVGGSGETLTDNVIAYNVCINNVISGGFHLGGTFGIKLERFRVENNVFVEMGTRDVTIGIFSGTVTAANLQYRNNIFYIPNHRKAISADGLLHENNFYYLGGKTDLGVPLGKGEKILDPLFMDLKNQNFHLSPKSMAIDAGTRLQYTKDYDGNVVPFGSGTDVGAFEYFVNRRKK